MRIAIIYISLISPVYVYVRDISAIYVRRREPRSSVLLHGLYSVLPEVLSI